MTRFKRFSKDELRRQQDGRYTTKNVGGPKKYFRKLRVRKKDAKPARLGYYEQITSDWFTTLTETIKRRRVVLGISQAALAKKLRTTQTLISRFENGKTNPTAEFIDRYCKALRLKLSVKIEE